MYKSDQYDCISLIQHDSSILFVSGVIVFGILSFCMIYYKCTNVLINPISWVMLVYALYAIFRSLPYNDHHWWHWIQFIVLSSLISFTVLGICVKNLVNVIKEICYKNGYEFNEENGIKGMLFKLYKFMTDSLPRSEVMREY